MERKIKRTLTGKSRTHDGQDERQVLIRTVVGPDPGDQGVRQITDETEWWPEDKALALQASNQR